MVLLIARYYVTPGNVDAVIAALQKMAPLVKEHEPNCSLYTANLSQEDPNLIVLVEQYTDMDAIAAHRETPHFKEIIECTVIPMLEKRERDFYDVVVG
jgi:quinol monooxygenase YgiN